MSRVPGSRWDRVKAEPALMAFLPPPVGAPVPRLPDPDAARAHVADLNVRFGIAEEWRSELPRQIALTEVSRGDGMVIYAVPTREAGSRTGAGLD